MLKHKKAKKTLTILSWASCLALAPTPFAVTSCSNKNLVLDTSALEDLNLFAGGDSAKCKLSATYNKKNVELDTVVFHYSSPDKLYARWNKATQEVTINPRLSGSTALTIDATDTSNNSCTKTIFLTVVEDAEKKLELDTKSISTTQNLGNTTSAELKAKYGGKNTTLADVSFTYSDEDILKASWDSYTNKVTIVPYTIGKVTLTITATDINNHHGIQTLDIEVDSKVHKFINDRTFTLYDWKEKNGVGGTIWLFYHETEAKAKNNYTYYALTNNHVTSGYRDLRSGEIPQTMTLTFGYQDWESAKNDKTSFLPSENWNIEGKPNQMNILDSAENQAVEYSKFKVLFTTYLKTTEYNHYQDISICKIDFGEYKDTPLANRLNDLNDYAKNHENYLVQFDDYSNTKDTTLFTGGYPAEYLCHDEGKLDNGKTKFQSQMFTDCYADIYKNIDAIASAADLQAKEIVSDDVVYTAENKYDSRGKLFTPDWQKFTINPYIKFGSGASGSLAIRAEDPNNIDTYKTSGIYWGGLEYSSSLAWYFYCHFTPFILNFNQNLTGNADDYNIIKSFMNSVAFSNNTPVNQMYYEAK